MNEVLSYHKKKQPIISVNKEINVDIGIKKPINSKKVKLKLNENKEKSVNGILIEACGEQINPDSDKETGFVL